MDVTLREERVSRNFSFVVNVSKIIVTLREERVSRNLSKCAGAKDTISHAPRGACE